MDTFIPLLELKLSKPITDKDNKNTTEPKLTRGEEEWVDDILRGTVLSLAQLKGVETLKDYFLRHGIRPYEYRSSNV